MATKEQYASWIVQNAGKKGTPEFETVRKAYELAKSSDSGGLLTTRAEADMYRARQENPELAAQMDRGNSLPSAESIAGSKAYRALQGVADLPIGIVQLAANIQDYGDDYEAIKSGPLAGMSTDADLINRFINRREDLIRSGRDESGSKGIDWTRLLGSMTAGGAVSKMLPAGASLAGKIGQNAWQGAAFGAATPTEGDTRGDVLASKAASAAVGGVLGGALGGLPTALRAGWDKISKSIDLSPDATARRLGRALRDVSGEKADDVIRELRSNPDELNAALAAVNAKSAGFSAFDDMVARRADVRLSERAALNRYRRELLDWAGTADEVEALRKARNAISKNFLKTKTQLSPELMNLLESNVVQDVVPSAVKLTEDELAKSLRSNGLKIPSRTEEVQAINPTNLMPQTRLGEGIIPDRVPMMEDATLSAAVRSADTMPGVTRTSSMFEKPAYEINSNLLQNIKLGLDAKIKGQPDTAIDEILRGRQIGAKEKIVELMRNKTPGYEDFRSEYIRQSVPINQKELGQALRNALPSPQTAMAAADDDILRQRDAFQNLLKNEARTIKSASGNQIYDKLEDVLTPEMMGSVRKVSESLNKDARLRELVKEGTKIAESELHDIDIGRLPGMLEREVLLANKVLKSLGDKQVQSVLDLYKGLRTKGNYGRVADIMERANQQNPAVANTMKLLEYMNRKGLSERAILPIIAGQTANEMTESQRE